MSTPLDKILRTFDRNERERADRQLRPRPTTGGLPLDNLLDYLRVVLA